MITRPSYHVGGMPALAVVVIDPGGDRAPGLLTGLKWLLGPTALSKADPVRHMDWVTPAERETADTSPVYAPPWSVW